MAPVTAMTEHGVSLEGGVRGTWAAAAAAGPVPCAVFLHGFGGHRNEVGSLFSTLAVRLSERGIASLRIDFPGCGESPGEFGDITIALYSQAARAAVRFARDQPDTAPGRLGLLGYSFGGAVATTCLRETDVSIRSLALWAPVGNPKADMIESIGAAKAAEAERKGWTELAWGERKIRLKRAFFAGLADAAPVEAVADYDGDLFVAAGSRDRLVKYVGPIHAAARRARSRAQRIIDGADHFFGGPDPASGYAEALLADTADFFAVSLAR